MKLEIGGWVLSLFEAEYKDVTINGNCVKVLNGKNKIRTISIFTNNESIPISKKMELFVKDAKTEQVPQIIPLQTFEAQLQEIQSLGTRIEGLNQDFSQQQEELLRLSNNWSHIEKFNLKLKEISEFKDICERKQEANKMMWDDQRAVNDQQWKKITRVER